MEKFLVGLPNVPIIIPPLMDGVRPTLIRLNRASQLQYRPAHDFKYPGRQPDENPQGWFEQRLAEISIALGGGDIPYAFVDPSGAGYRLDVGATTMAVSRGHLRLHEQGDRVTSVALTEKFWQSRGSDPFDVNEIDDARIRETGLRIRREGQEGFRNDLLNLYDGRCAITGCNIGEALEAAHIIDYHGPISNHPRNGLLLRADIHALFDSGLIAFAYHGLVLRVVVHPRLVESEYGRLSGQTVRDPNRADVGPSPRYVDKHRLAWGLSS